MWAFVQLNVQVSVHYFSLSAHKTNMYFTFALFGSVALCMSHCVSDQALVPDESKSFFRYRYNIFCVTFGIAICLSKQNQTMHSQFPHLVSSAQMPIDKIIGATYTDSICTVSTEWPGGCRYCSLIPWSQVQSLRQLTCCAEVSLWFNPHKRAKHDSL